MSTQAVQVSRFENRLILSNAVQLGSSTIRKIAGNDIADGFGGASLSENELANLVAAKLSSYLDNPTGGQK